MRLPQLFRREIGLTSRLLRWFLAIALIPCLAITLAIEYVSSQALDASVRRELLALGEARAMALDAFLRERRGDVTLAGHLKFIIEATRELKTILDTDQIDSPRYRELSEPYRRVMGFYQDAYGYNNAYLFDTDGKLLLRMKEGLRIGANLQTGPLKDSELSDLFERAKMLLQGVTADFEVYPGMNEPLSFVAAPVIDEQGINIGIVALELGNQAIYRILNEYNGLGETGELVVGQKRGDEAVIVAPTRFDRNAAFRRKARIGGLEMGPLQRAVVGMRGFTESIDYRGEPVVAVTAFIPALRWGLVVKQDRSEAYATLIRLRAIVGGLLAVTVLGVIAAALTIARSLSRPVLAAVEVANKVASGDLTPQIDMKARGEIGTLVRAIGTMTGDLRSLIGRIQKSSISLMSTATEIAATSKQQEQTVHEYGMSTNEAAAAVKEISATGQELLRTMNDVNGVASETAELASHGQESLVGMDKTMHQLAESTASIGSKLSVISERAANINLVVTTITKVADQTNLLSINAAIEAEKAGEYGLGFLVVAREIRRLADQTAVSTLDIERMVKEMQYSVSAGVMEMDKFSDQVRQGVREVAHISEQLAKIITAVQGLTERFDQVTEGMRVQSQGADQIREAVVHLSDGVNQTLLSLREFNQATGHLREAVGGLKEEVSRFRVDTTAAR